jgi:tellurite resistance protein TehA-like permease
MTESDSLSKLSPAYFALVMATGIVAIAAQQAGLQSLAVVLFWLNVGQYVAIWILNLWRLVRYRGDLAADLADHLRGFGFFTSVAGTCVLGSQFVLMFGAYSTAVALWFLSLILWLGLTYAIFIGVMIKEAKPTLDQGITGAWLLAVVATQAIAVLGALLAHHFEQPYRLYLNFLALSMWL